MGFAPGAPAPEATQRAGTSGRGPRADQTAKRAESEAHRRAGTALWPLLRGDRRRDRLRRLPGLAAPLTAARGGGAPWQ